MGVINITIAPTNTDDVFPVEVRESCAASSAPARLMGSLRQLLRLVIDHLTQLQPRRTRRLGLSQLTKTLYPRCLRPSACAGKNSCGRGLLRCAVPVVSDQVPISPDPVGVVPSQAYDLQVNEEDPVANLRQTAEIVSGIKQADQHMVVNGAPLKQNGTVKDAGLADGDVIMLDIKQTRPAPAQSNPFAQLNEDGSLVDPERLIQMLRDNPAALAQMRGSMPEQARAIEQGDVQQAAAHHAHGEASNAATPQTRWIQSTSGA